MKHLLPLQSCAPMDWPWWANHFSTVGATGSWRLAARYAVRCNLHVSRVRRGRRADELWRKLDRGSIARPASMLVGFSRVKSLPTCLSCCRQGFDLVTQPQDRKDARPRRAADAARARRRGDRMIRRREFITLLGGAAAAWPLAARAQQPSVCGASGYSCHACRRSGSTGPRRGVSAGTAAIGLDRRPQRADRLPLERGADAGLARQHAAELVALGTGRHRRTAALRPLSRCCRRPAPYRSCSRIGADPVGAGFVDSLARPGGNVTGFTVARVRLWRQSGWSCSKRSRRA